MNIESLLKMLVERKGSDLHLSAGCEPYLRINGIMVKSEFQKLQNNDIQDMIFGILTEKQRTSFLKNWELDCNYSIKGLSRFRLNVFIQNRGLSVVFRGIPEFIPSIESLGLPSYITNLVDVPNGLIVVTGPTGSGKSTTLAALINYINQKKRKHIVTIEDPIEFIHENRLSLINQREVLSHTKSFTNALKAVLREDPDVILVGEMRDLETMELAIKAAETGHIVFGTLHTNGAPQTIDRIINVFPNDQQEQIRVMLAESLRGTISQLLVPRSDREGRVAALEILVKNPAISSLIRSKKTFQIASSMQTGRGEGMITFEQYFSQLVEKKIITEEVMRMHTSTQKSVA